MEDGEFPRKNQLYSEYDFNSFNLNKNAMINKTV